MTDKQPWRTDILAMPKDLTGAEQTEAALLATKVAGCNCDPNIRRLNRAERRRFKLPIESHYRIEHDPWCRLQQRSKARYS
jgi:hypothetical protein